MHGVYVTSRLVLSWLLMFLMLGIGVGVTTLAGWFGVALLAAVPAAVLVRAWRDPARVTSRSI
jgi:hypothetical protein